MTGGAFRATDRAAELCGPDRAGELFAELFRARFLGFDYSVMFLDEDPATEVHRHAAYSLWVLRHLDDRWWHCAGLLALLLPPRVRGMKMRPSVRTRMAPSPMEFLLVRFLEPLTDFLVVEARATQRGEAGWPFDRFRKTELLDRFIRFDFGSKPPVFRLQGVVRALRREQ